MAERNGPTVSIEGSCEDCKFSTTGFANNQDRADDIYCSYGGQLKTVGKRDFTTPNWCPLWDIPLALAVRLKRAEVNATKPSLQAILENVMELSPSDVALGVYLCDGLSNEEIADRLDTKVGTVKSRLFRLYDRLGVKSRAQFVAAAYKALLVCS